ncbi:MAG: hypothetical protein IKR48_12210 [Kiritimatiellae bacterium]|nr:hypothetical protein [Kiritimatiellia bacterium]
MVCPRLELPHDDLERGGYAYYLCCEEVSAPLRVADWNIRWSDIPRKEQDEYILRIETVGCGLSTGYGANVHLSRWGGFDIL